MRHASQPGAWPLAALLLCVSGPLSAENLILQDVRHWTLNGVTRVAVQLNGKAEVRRDRLFKPERYFFDFQNTGTSRNGMQTIAVGDSLIRQIRIAEARPGVARVVLDLVEAADVVTTELDNPYRLIIEVKRPGTVTLPRSYDLRRATSCNVRARLCPPAKDQISACRRHSSSPSQVKISARGDAAATTKLFVPSLSCRFRSRDAAAG